MMPEQRGQVSDDGDRKKGTGFRDVWEIKAAGLGNGLDMGGKGDGVVKDACWVCGLFWDGQSQHSRRCDTGRSDLGNDINLVLDELCSVVFG